MVSFGATVGDAAWRVNGRGDLARMDRVFEDRRTYVYRAHAVRIHARGWANLVGRRELGVRSQRDTKPRWRGEVLSNRRLVMLTTVAKKTPVLTAFAIVIVTAVEVTRETSRLWLRLRELMLRRRVEAMGVWIRKIWVDSWGTVVANGFTVGRVADEPGDIVGLLHGVCGGRGGRAS